MFVRERHISPYELPIGDTKIKTLQELNTLGSVLTAFCATFYVGIEKENFRKLNKVLINNNSFITNKRKSTEPLSYSYLPIFNIGLPG